MNVLVIMGMSYDVLPGKEGAFEAAFRGVAEALAGTAGHVATRLYRDVDRPGTYLIYSEWADREAFSGFVRSAAFADVTRWGREEILAGPPRHRVLTDDNA